MEAGKKWLIEADNPISRVVEEEGSQVNAFVAKGLSPSAISNQSTGIEPAEERSSV